MDGAGRGARRVGADRAARPVHTHRTPPTHAPDLSAILTAAEALTAPESFTQSAAALGIEFETGDLDRLGRYLAMLMEVNKTTNLTAVRDPDEAWTRHVLDSLTLLPALVDLPAGSQVIDVGSGGGLPGIPLAVTLPSLRFTLLEATGKKAEFLRGVIATLGLDNARVHAERAERAGHDRGEKMSVGAITQRSGGHREAYDAVIARAVGRLNTLAELTVPFAKIGGRILLIKGAQAEDELAEAAGALEALKAVHEATIDTPTGRIIVLGKRVATPRNYPRADGEPKRSPLGQKAAGKPGRA